MTPLTRLSILKERDADPAVSQFWREAALGGLLDASEMQREVVGVG